MALVAFDTNGYIHLARGTPTGQRVAAYLRRERPSVGVLLPVLAEFLFGLPAPQDRRRFLAVACDAVPERRRFAPTPADWCEAGAVVARMRASDPPRGAGGRPAPRVAPQELAGRGFFLDVVVAVTCRARGLTLATDDADHARIAAYVGHRITPLP